MNVQIIAFVSATRMSTASRHVVARYVVKQADMPLDVGAAAVALAEIAYARLVAIYGLTRHMDGTLDDGLGHPEPLPRQDCAGIDYLAEEYILDRERAVDWLKAAATQTESEVLHV
ncbi:MAG: hypothetical protein IMZ55_09265 [Acidobacteria bacterium]|nr:hypothetical protein [Acidobacteriota bacterium]